MDCIDYSLNEHKHSLVAAACILCDRKQTGQYPLWNKMWADVSGYSLDDIRGVALTVWKSQ